MARSVNSSNLMAHLCNNHKPLYSHLRTTVFYMTKAEPQTLDQPTINSSFLCSQPYSRHGKRWNELTDFVTRFLVKNELPMYAVQRDVFRQMLKKIYSRYEIPDQSPFSHTAVPELYAVTRGRVAEQMAAVTCFASTTDLWSSIDLKPFISYTIQYMTDNLELECLSLITSYLPKITLVRLFLTC